MIFKKKTGISLKPPHRLSRVLIQIKIRHLKTVVENHFSCRRDQLEKSNVSLSAVWSTPVYRKDVISIYFNFFRKDSKKNVFVVYLKNWWFMKHTVCWHLIDDICIFFTSDWGDFFSFLLLQWAQNIITVCTQYKKFLWEKLWNLLRSFSSKHHQLSIKAL